MRIKTKDDRRVRIQLRQRKRISGTKERPRLSVYRSVEHIYVQLIDDSKGVTLAQASSLEVGVKPNSKKHLTGGNVTAAKVVGKSIAERAKAKGVTRVVFDRGGYLYHGRVKALADAAREAGLQF